MQIYFLGTADAFSSSGRNQSAIYIKYNKGAFLIDCGPNTLTAMKRLDIPTQSLDFALISHAHGDHCAGIPFLFLEYEYMTERDRAFSVLGPEGLQDRIEAGTVAFYPTLDPTQRRFQTHYHTLTPSVPYRINDVTIHTHIAKHVVDFPCYAYQIEIEGKRIAFTGDTGWTDEIVKLCDHVDFLITECTYLHTFIDIHLSYEEIQTHRQKLHAKRIILTHVGDDVRKNAAKIPIQIADDGLIIDL